MRFLRSRRASAALQFVLGVGTLLMVTTFTLDLVRFIQLQGRVERTVRTIADYASRNPQVDCREVEALARFAHAETLGEKSSGLLVLTSAAGDTGGADGFVEDWTWNPPVVLGATDSINGLTQCRDGLTPDRAETLGMLGMSDGDRVVVAQLCLAPDPAQFLSPAWVQENIGMAIYRHHVVPTRSATLSQVCT